MDYQAEIASLVARLDAMQANERRLIDKLAASEKEAERYRKLEAQATEQLLHPSRAACEIMPDLRTHWRLPVLMCSGPVGGSVSFADAVDALPAVGAA
jgi:hypothetical protein